MRHKKHTGLGTKFEGVTDSGEKDSITNMEGALHTFLVPICVFIYHSGHKMSTEMLVRSFKEHIRVEWQMLERLCPQGYIDCHRGR